LKKICTGTIITESDLRASSAFEIPKEIARPARKDNHPDLFDAET
jgi:hypothetical protein